MTYRGLTFGIFLAPFHRPGENPKLALERDVELIQ
jgi:limonene 1,2-monooxygenase